MIYLFRETVFNCREATLLSVKREEGNITLFERVRLAYHLLYCRPCRRFVDQWRILTRRGHHASFRTDRPPFALSEESRNRIRRQMEEWKS